MAKTSNHKIEYFNLLDKWISEYPDKLVAIDGRGDMTYAQMDEWSARIYAWLKSHGYGREDFIMIHLERSARVLAAVQGIFKAGAAYVICPLDFPKERYDFVYRDCGCKIEITEALYDEMMQCEPLPGREDPDLHDAVYAVYTSGTEGNPKGVLHEYGKLDMTWKSARCAGEPFVCFDDIYGLIAPCNFGVFNICTVHILANGGTIFLAPSEIVKNPQELKAAYEKVGVTVTYLPPSFLRALTGFNSQLRKLMLCSEMANGVYYDDIMLINAHAMSESCFETATFLIDRAYDAPPVGKPQFDNKVFIIDGEYCFENAYFRGYINKPEMTAKCMKDGIYHSGDMAYMLDDGNFVLTGRKDFMLKISGNRVEPAEVEGLVKRGLGLKQVIVRGYKDGGRSYLCAYYTDDVEIVPREAREKMSKIAPKYMIPEYFVKMDKFPLIANGKMDYQALKKPDVNDYRRPYAAPETEVQKQVCEAFEDVLGLNDIGLDDDFFELGGDSIRAIRMSITLTELMGLDDVGIGSPEVYSLRTPRAIAEKVAGNVADGREVDGPVPAEVYSQYMLDYQMENPESTRFNTWRLFRFDLDGLDGRELAEKLASALETVCLAHPQLHSVFVKEDGVWNIVNAPEKMQKIVVEEMSEAECEAVKKTIIKPFVPGECVYDFRVIHTGEHVYMLNCFHHPAIDGKGIQAFRRNLARALKGEALVEDHYLKCRAELEAMKGTERYEDDKAYLDGKFGCADGTAASGDDCGACEPGCADAGAVGNDDRTYRDEKIGCAEDEGAGGDDCGACKWECIPTPDREGDGIYGILDCRLPDDADTGNVQATAAVLNAMARYNAERATMAASSAKAMDEGNVATGGDAAYCGKNVADGDVKNGGNAATGAGRNVMLTWTYHNRDTKEKQDCVGLFIRDIPAGIRVEATDSKEDIIRKVEAEIEDGIKHMSYQWSMFGDKEILYTVNQGDMRDFEGLESYKCEPIELPYKGGNNMADNPMDMEIMGGSDKRIRIKYNTGMYDTESVERFASLIVEWYR